MGSPDNSAPPRPREVPPDARWDPKDAGFEWVKGDVDGDGRRHGFYQCWTRDGRLHGECTYEHGNVHGANKNSAFFRSERPSPEPFAQAAENVWSVRYYTRDGKTNYTIRYFLRDGTECGPDGQPLPPRPATVSPDARWFPDMDRWVCGQIARGTNLQIGHWRWWSREGTLRHEEQRDAQGDPPLVVQYRADGTKQKRTERSDAGEERDYHFDDGSLSTRYRSDAAGREDYKASWLRAGTLDAETERAFDGDALVRVRVKGRGGVLAFEARREGTGVACVLYGADGKTLAATGMIERDRLAGTWRIFDERGTLRREVDVTPLALEHMVTGRGLTWRLGEACFSVDDARLPLPARLQGVDGEPWADPDGCYSEAVEQFPRLLRALASPDPFVRAFALGAIESEIEHQGTTYPATARVVPYLARLLSHPLVDRRAQLATLQAVGDGCSAALAAAWPDVFALFSRAPPEERRQILVLAKFAPDAQHSLLELARHDRDPAVRAVAVDSLAPIE